MAFKISSVNALDDSSVAYELLAPNTSLTAARELVFDNITSATHTSASGNQDLSISGYLPPASLVFGLIIPLEIR